MSSSRNNNSISVIDRLTGIGLKSIKWIGKCEADKIVQGTYDVPPNEGGNYALVIDNTFSKQLSKTVTLVLFTHPTAVPPQSGLTTPATRPSGAAPQEAESSESSARNVNNGNHLTHSANPENIHTGVLHKRRRRRHQGWARRYFALDFTASTLSYYHDPNTSTLRGSIPLSLAAVATNEKSREISVDSGAEIWHLRALNEQDFISWKRALEKGSSQASDDSNQSDQLLRVPSLGTNPADDRQWDKIKSLVNQLSGSRDSVLQLAKDSDPKYLVSERPRGRSPSASPSLTEANGDDYFASRAKRAPFWKRKSSATSQPGGKGSAAGTPSQLTVPSPGTDAASPPGERKAASITSPTDQAEEFHDHLMGVLRDLDRVVSEFSSLIAERKRRHHAAPLQPRRSMESDVSQEFFDAVDGGDGSGLLTIQDSDDEEVDNADAAKQAEEEDEMTDDAPSDSDDDTLHEASTANGHGDQSPLFPTKPKSLTPLPMDVVKRRANVLAPTVLPPSLIGFFRKNVGKDLSQISLPVSSNEPLSLLQRAAEAFEYSELLDKAAATKDGMERLMLVTAFALSSLANNRVRERAIRKPFNPMLGETYELVREDRGFRFVSEKVSHRPVQLAYLAESKDWSLAQSPMPSQKFWGKSAEIVAEGKFRLTLHTTGEHFSWSSATSFLRNIIAGEKYVEPVGELTVLNESTRQKAVSTFKAGGMFSGRSEDVSTKAVDSSGNDLPLGLTGNWTSSLQLTKNGSTTGSPVWSAGSLVPNSPKHYGWTSFAACLNEITPVEKGKLPPTDSRLRPDQRALEDGDIDRAEEVKVHLEEGQRARRREMESAGESWTPRWFVRVEDGSSEGDVAWRLKSGKDGYWEERARGTWSGVVPVFKM